MDIKKQRSKKVNRQKYKRIEADIYNTAFK